MDAFLNENNFRRKDLRVSNPIISDEQDVVITSSGIPLTQIFVLRLFAFSKVSITTWLAY